MITPGFGQIAVCCKRIIRGWLIISVVILHAAAFTTANAGESDVQVKLSRTDLLIGDQFDYTLSLTSSPDLRVVFPSREGALGDCEIKNFRIVTRNSDNSITYSGIYRLAVYRTGELVIPSGHLCVMQNSIVKNIPFSAVPVTVRAITPNAEDSGDIRDVKPPMSLPYNRLVLVSIIAGCLILAVIVYMIYRRFNRHRVPDSSLHETSADPYLYLGNKLRSIDPATYINAGRHKEYYSLISDLIREFIERRTMINALDMTTRELLHTLAGTGIPGDIRNELKLFLQESDQVKFARYMPSAGEAENYHITAQRLLDRIHEIVSLSEENNAQSAGTSGAPT